MFVDIREQVPEAEYVRGRSWMYNLPSYQRLFPAEYLRAAAPVEPELQFMSLWGQYLDHTWQVQSERTTTFLQAIATASTTGELRRSFPMPVLAPRSPVAYFLRALRHRLTDRMDRAKKVAIPKLHLAGPQLARGSNAGSGRCQTNAL